MTARTPGSTAFLFIFLTVLIEMIGVGIIFPSLPKLIMDIAEVEIGDAARIGGLLTFAFALAQFLCAPVVGAISDRFGRRPILIASLTGYGIDYLIMGCAPILWVLFVGRALSGVFASTISTAYAYVADISDAEERAGRFGKLGAAFGAGFVIGPAIGGLLGREFGPHAPFFAAGGLALANALFGFFVLPETLKAENRRAFDIRRANPVGGLLSIARNRVILSVLATFFLVQLAWMVLPSTWPYFATARFKWGPDEVGWSLAYVGVLAIVVQGGLAGPIVKRFGARGAALLGMASAGASLIVYAFAPDWRWVCFGLTVGGLGGIVNPALQSMMSNRTAASEQGELQGAVASVQAITLVIAPLMFTQVFALFAPPDPIFHFLGAPYALATVIFALGAAAFAIFTRGDGATAPVSASLSSQHEAE